MPYYAKKDFGVFQFSKISKSVDIGLFLYVLDLLQGGAPM